MRPTTLATAALVALSFAAPHAASAADGYNVTTGVTAAGAPLGLHGVDPVAYLATGAPVEGTATHTAVHDGVAYYFADAESMATFEADPAAYLPQYGGFCAYGVSVGKKFDGDPAFGAIVDGKLYVFLNADIFAAFEADPDGTLANADAQWPRIRDVPTGEL